jgi:hypothetical protein
VSVNPESPIPPPFVGVQGRKQFLTAKREMLNAYDEAREKARAHKTETFHGRVAEAEFRKWLSEFLPKRYGVTSGYIVSQGQSELQTLPHFDVIVYDQLESPVLWLEDSADTSSDGASRAVPCEYVCGVLEVKSAFSSQTVKHALDHLGELDPLLAANDTPIERYPRFLPDKFFRAVVFFELRDADRRGMGALKEFLRTVNTRGYFRSLILRGFGLPGDDAGIIEVLRNANSPPQPFGWGNDLLTPSGVISENEMMFGTYFGTNLMFSSNGFQKFAFDLVALLKGSYEPGRLSSFHAFSRAIIAESHPS